jgi:hypothetical protein
MSAMRFARLLPITFLPNPISANLRSSAVRAFFSFCALCAFSRLLMSLFTVARLRPRATPARNASRSDAGEGYA